jgi:penicillin-insensitive murein DD-endopeptidase
VSQGGRRGCVWAGAPQPAYHYKHVKSGWAFILGLVLAAVPRAALADDPTQGRREQAVGFYSDGKLVNPDKLALSGAGWVKVFQPRDRGYGTFDLLKIIMDAAKTMRHEYPGGERLQIGDTSGPRGGEISGHASHRNGLDADVVFYRVDRREQDTQSVAGFVEKFVSNGKVTANFDTARNWRFLELVVSTERVQRVFVDAAIKWHLCEWSALHDLPERAAILRRLRPLEFHDDHFHVRVTCPAKSPRCEAQEEPPEGDGCAEVIPGTTRAAPGPFEVE